MKKIVKITLCLSLFSVLFGCSKKADNVLLKDDVTFQMLDVMRIKNTESNSIYYYYMAEIKNESNQTYDTSLVSYNLTDDKDENIHLIDKYMSTPASSLQKGQSTYVYGYAGFPNNNQKNVGFYFPKTKDFLAFDSVKVREAENKQIKEKGTKKFTLFEDKTMAITVDASKMKTTFDKGTTSVSNLYVTYKNKTDHLIVIPYLEAQGVLNGIDLTKYKDKGDFSTMDLKTYKEIDFTNDGLAPKTENFKGTATGYIVYYLEPDKQFQCDIGFTFENAGIDYKDKDKDVLTINLISNSFGSTTTFKIPYE